MRRRTSVTSRQAVSAVIDATRLPEKVPTRGSPATAPQQNAAGCPSSFAAMSALSGRLRSSLPQRVILPARAHAMGLHTVEGASRLLTPVHAAPPAKNATSLARSCRCA